MAFTTPAGVATGTMNLPRGLSLNMDRPWSQQTQHTLSPFHQVRPSGVVPSDWYPKEACVKPNYDAQAAGMCSYIDNTMRISPLKPFWGQTRALSRHESASPFRVLPEQTLAAIRYPQHVPSLESSEEMPSVLKKYSPAVPVFEHKYDPARLSSGFISSPVALSPASRLMASTSSPALSTHTPSPNAHAGSSMLKFSYDQTAGLAHIPVARRTLAL
mmetsp:Transcript_21355/g.43190  ORF Transcript_21355/g.43190 Transcript_21355/m.43190 type:complete len:216 (-) Transcript_21355:278-925(-)